MEWLPSCIPACRRSEGQFIGHLSSFPCVASAGDRFGRARRIRSVAREGDAKPHVALRRALKQDPAVFDEPLERARAERLLTARGAPRLVGGVEGGRGEPGAVAARDDALGPELPERIGVLAVVLGRSADVRRFAKPRPLPGYAAREAP